MRCLFLLGLLLLPSCAAADFTGAHHVSATINRSEFGTANRLSLDLRTGRYSITPGIRTEGFGIGKKRISRQFGRLPDAVLDDLRTKSLQAVEAGLHDADCLKVPDDERYVVVEEGGPKELVFRIDNGGEKEVVVSMDNRTVSARDRLACWTNEGEALYNSLENTFEDNYGGRAYDPEYRSPPRAFGLGN